MTAKELYCRLDEMIPPSLSCDWDNDGLMVETEEKQIRRALVALDVTSDIVERAVEGGYDVIVSHHPLIFKPLKNITCGNAVARNVASCLTYGISVMSFHTRLDALEGGVNDALAERIGLTGVRPFDSIGRVGRLSAPMSAREFAEFLCERLSSDCVKYVGDGNVSTVALVGGDGKDFFSAARAAGADTYLTGQMSYNMMAEAAESGMNVFEAGHFFTEHPVCVRLSDMLRSLGIESDIAVSNPVNTVFS